MSFAGKLLVALPILTEAPFHRTVILLLTHGDGGAIGVVINRPSATDLGSVLPRWDDRAAEPAVVFYGGPVEQETAIALGAGDHGIETVDLDGDPALVTRVIRVYAGYAGWAPGQLEDEIVEGAWAVVDGRPGDAFRADAGDLWHLVLDRQPPPLNRLALLPEDLSVN